MQASNYCIKVAWQKIRNKSNIKFFYVLFRTFVVFTHLFRKSLDLLAVCEVRSDNLNL